MTEPYFTYEEANEIAEDMDKNHDWDERMDYILDFSKLEPSICHKCKRWHGCYICKVVSAKIKECPYMDSENT